MASTKFPSRLSRSAAAKASVSLPILTSAAPGGGGSHPVLAGRIRFISSSRIA